MLKKVFYGIGILAIIGACIAFYGYNAVYQDNVNDDTAPELLEIPTGSSFEDVLKILDEQQVLLNKKTFTQVAKLMSYDKEVVPSGRYFIKKTFNNRQLISVLRSGMQIPVKVTFNNHRTLNETLGAVSHYFEPDSVSFVEYFNRPDIIKNTGHTKESLLTLFIPNTYQMYWSTTPKKLLTRMTAEHKEFWDRNDRLAKCEKQGLTKTEVYTLASIVEKESQATSERPIIAGLYLNRLKQGIPLQADPTVVYAVGDFSIRRVLNKHLATDSPYNTYKYGGLPPGPIYLPSIESIDAVLNPTDHDYLFMCAKPGYNSEHAFAKSAAEHGRNANKYRTWLTRQGILK